MTQTAEKLNVPTEAAVLLVIGTSNSRWSLSADEIAGRLERLGFERPSSQGLALKLKKMTGQIPCLVSRARLYMGSPYSYQLTDVGREKLRLLMFDVPGV